MNSTNGNGMGTDLDALSLEAIEKQLEQFEQEERARLGLPTEAAKQWFDAVPREFTASQRAHTTILVCGLTMAHDLFIQAALRGIGYKVMAMDVPDNDALQYGREYGNRGQCNPTYFTVGNLVKYLSELREQGMSKEDIVKNYVFVTAGACGPCRFGTYVTEYRKALRDSGFDGFRVLLFQQTGGLKQATGEEMGLQMNPAFFWSIIRAIMIGDALNVLGYRMRPYEVEPGAADRAIEIAKKHVSTAFEKGESLSLALYRARKVLGAVKVDRTRTKPKVGIIGEFWAMTTEGDGNYGLQRFLEAEGAEVDIQIVTSWLLYMLWQSRFDTAERAKLHGTDKKSESKFSLEGVDVRKRVLTLWAAERVLRGLFQTIAHAIGLYDYHLPDMNENAEISHEFYDNNLRGGEGHMEVGKLIQNVAKAKVNMTLSVKPFGCMPSSSVSDGVQSLITELYPQAIFLPIETNGDGAVNVYSRVQMQLFKAKQQAAKEVEKALADTGMTMDEVRAWLAKHPDFAAAFHKAPHHAGCSTADLVYEVGARRKTLSYLKNRVVEAVTRKQAKEEHAAHERLLAVARRAAERVRSKKSVVQVAPETLEGVSDDGRPAIPAGRKSLRIVN
ncbi:MAG: 2-hydroxyglutaryl-CoA dehydratase [Kofleriaceae bacterium]|nr:2-hydroxyglutaryl-CoA dehydratase [Myxococcales bacterium]MCB9563238.1 2-hydroxyglutaryl-CoA dehydratase [Kofleriaceae bacterium]MCB9573580.1 2-hydroxyglutaryl-CoA dehydratase [Kofleriaceae bacterium]